MNLPSSPTPIRICGFLLATLALTPGLDARDVSFQRHEDKSSEGSVEQFRYSIDGAAYQSAPLLDWTLVSNYSGMDFVAVSPKFSTSFVGLKITPCVDAKGKPSTTISQESLPALTALFLDPQSRYEGDIPTIQEPVDRLEFDIKRFVGADSWQCHYRLKVVDDMVWIIASELSPEAASDGQLVYTTLEGTFGKAAP